jgi:hypothetical protein
MLRALVVPARKIGTSVFLALPFFAFDSFLGPFVSSIFHYNFSILILPSRSWFRVRHDTTPNGIGHIVTLLPERRRLQRSPDLSLTSPASLHFARRLAEQQGLGT